MTANHLRPTPPLIAGQVTVIRKGSMDVWCPHRKDWHALDVLVRTYDDGAETVSTRDPSDRFARWSVEAPLIPGVLL